jgi:hypothetical protein
MPIFNPSTHDVYICMFASGKHGREETDESLYFDTHQKRFFIVESSEFQSGPNVTCNHSIRQISVEQARTIVESNPEWLAKAMPYFPEG